MTLGQTAAFQELFPDDMIRTILQLIQVAWKKAKLNDQRANENNLTKSLLSAVRVEKRKKNLPFQVFREVWIDDADDPSFRIDLSFTYGANEDVYFGVEAKRLNVQGADGRVRTGAQDYCDEGILRFVESEYAKGLPVGAMLGYVMDGKCDVAMHAIESVLCANTSRFCVGASPCLQGSSLLSKCKEAKQTNHVIGDRPFVLHHLFVPLAA